MAHTDFRSWPTTEKKSTKITLDSVLAVTEHPFHEAVFIPFRPDMAISINQYLVSVANVLA
jgi:hypothetical protein